MRILLLTRDFPPFEGGIAQLAFGLVSAFSRAGHDVTVHCRLGRGDQPSAPAGVDTVVLGERGSGRPSPRAALAAYRAAGGDPDLIVAAHWKALAPLTRPLRASPAPVVMIAHAKEVAAGLPWLQRLRIRSCLRAADEVVAVSAYTAEQLALRFHGMGTPTRVIPPGVDTRRFQPGPVHPDLRERFGIAAGPILLTVARLVERKGHDQVIRALPSLLQGHPDLTYVVCGGGSSELERRLRAQAATLGVEHRVVFTGSVSEDDIVQFYRDCTVVVMPSRTLERRGDAEGFGITFLEAGACGRPVVGGRAGGVGDAIVDGVTGLLVDPLDGAELAAALDRLLGDADLCGAMGRAGLDRVRAGFTWEAVAQRYLESATR